MDDLQQRASLPYDPAQAAHYGQFVQMAYDMYNGAQQNPTPPPPAPFPSDYKFISWIQMRDFIIEDGDWTFYGLIAQRTSKANEFVLAIRGTGDSTEWWDDLTSMALVPLVGFGQVAYGFNRIYQTLRVVDYASSAAPGAESNARSFTAVGTFAQQVAATVERHAAVGERPREMTAQAPSTPMSIEVTGHSLGAALATLYAAENAAGGHISTPLLCIFASPRVGNSVFAGKFNQLGITSWRIVNELDLVPKVPFLGFQHIETEHVYNSGSSVNWSLVCWHSLDTYLHLIDPKQPLSPQCTLSQKMATAAPLQSFAKGARPAAAAPVAAAKEISLSVPPEQGTTINITIKIA